MNAIDSQALDAALFNINELIARITVAQTIDVRMQLAKELKGAFATYLRDVTVTAGIGKNRGK